MPNFSLQGKTVAAKEWRNFVNQQTDRVTDGLCDGRSDLESHWSQLEMRSE